MINDSTSQAASPRSLKNGQIWMAGDQCLEVKNVGKLLVEVRITKQPTNPLAKRSRVAARFESVKTVLAFLQTEKAVLVPEPDAL